ncbi:MAG: hypothetical protein Q9227_004572 [Pyrenula ochraceoflavens]
MAAHLTNGQLNGTARSGGVSLADLPKSNILTSNLPPDPAFPTPAESHNAPRPKLGPRMVRDALYTFVRPEPAQEPELLSVSPRAMQDIGLKEGEQDTEDFKNLVSGNKMFWDEKEGGIYPWAQCYGGWQFGSWAGQLGDGRAISLFESTNPSSGTRYELQLKGAGRTPYSRFADGKAVLRSSLREYIISEALNALGIPTTRALSLTLLPYSQVVRERLEPGAIVCRFAQSWLRIGTFDLLRSRGDRTNIRRLATYLAEHAIPGSWSSLPGLLPSDNLAATPPHDIPPSFVIGRPEAEQNRFARLYRHIVRLNALTVAKWQAYGFMNGVLNTDNTSLLGLSMDYGPFAFMDNFDPSYTPNHDDHMLRYSYRNQPTIIWWNLVRLGEDLGELLGAGEAVDNAEFIEKGVSEDAAPEIVKRAETIIEDSGEEYKAGFLAEYKRLMTARLGLKSQQPTDFDDLFSPLLDTLEALELDFNHFFRRLSSVKLSDLSSEEKQKETAGRFFHEEGIQGIIGHDESSARGLIAEWLAKYHSRLQHPAENAEDGKNEAERHTAMKQVNPNFLPRGWILDELIERVEKKGDRDVLQRAMNMAINPFEDSWAGEGEGEVQGRKEEERWCGDVPRWKRGGMCSCSS